MGTPALVWSSRAIPSLLLAVLLGASAATAATPTPPDSVSLTLEKGTAFLSVTAHGVPLRAVLTEIARRAGFQVTEIVRADRPVSITFSGLPLDRALQQLLADENTILVYEPANPAGPARLTRLLLLGTRVGAPANPQGHTDPVPASAGEPWSSDAPPSMLPEDAEAFDPDGALEQLLLLAEHRDPRMRTKALEALIGHLDNDRALLALEDHIRDPDPRVRAVAVGLLGPLLDRWPGAEDRVWSALRDTMPHVRHLALRVLWEGSSPRARDAVKLALEDIDPGVRALAEELSQDERSEGPVDPGWVLPGDVPDAPAE